MHHPQAQHSWGLLVHLNEIIHSFPRLLAAAFAQFAAAWGIGVYADQAAAAPVVQGQQLTQAQALAQSDWYYKAQAAIALCGSITAAGGIYAAYKGKQVKEVKTDQDDIRSGFAAVRSELDIIRYELRKMIEQFAPHVSTPSGMSYVVEPPKGRPGDHADADCGTGDGAPEDAKPQ